MLQTDNTHVAFIILSCLWQVCLSIMTILTNEFGD